MSPEIVGLNPYFLLVWHVYGTRVSVRKKTTWEKQAKLRLVHLAQIPQGE